MYLKQKFYIDNYVLYFPHEATLTSPLPSDAQLFIRSDSHTSFSCKGAHDSLLILNPLSFSYKGAQFSSDFPLLLSTKGAHDFRRLLPPLSPFDLITHQWDIDR